MDYIVTTLLSYLLLYKYVTVFVVILLSSFLLPLPSNTLFMAAGTFASQGYFNVETLFVVGLISNCLGDISAFSVTRIWGNKIITKERMRKFSILAKIEDFFNAHSKMTIFLTRFTGTPGVVINFLAGLTEVPAKVFVFIDIVGNIINIVFFITLGYYLGVFSESYSDVLEILGWIVIVAIAIYLIVKLFLKNNNG